MPQVEQEWRSFAKRSHVGISVTAFVRSPEKLSGFAGLITVKQGNPLDSSALRTVAVEHDAVLSAFGPRVPIVPFRPALAQRLCSGAVERVARSWGQASDPRIGSILSSRML